jgi:hypothetical protein
MRVSLAYCATVLVLTGCSTIIEGRSQSIAVNTDPVGATCKFARNGSSLGSVQSTPGSLLIEKTKYDITVTCDKEGYDTATQIDHSGSAGATVGNIIFGLLGGPIAWGIDSATGADNKYDTPISVTLNQHHAPTQQGSDQKPADQSAAKTE